MSTLLIVDGFSLAFRAFYAYPLSLTLSSGQPINAVFGFMTLLLQAIDQFEPDYVMVCFDRPEQTFRKEAYELYKANRTEAPDEFKTQVPLFKQAAKVAGIFCAEEAGYEADDLMGVYAKVANAQGITTYLYTSDQDAFQLVNDLTFVVSAKKGHSKLVIFDRAAVFEKCGVYPEQIIDFKALKGDTSDNIPGVKGVGDKTAAKLIAEYTHLDHLYDNIESISSAALKDKLIRSKDDAYMSQFLATIKTDVVLPYSLEDWKIDLDWPELQKLFIDYEFKNLLKKYSHHFDQSLPLMEAQPASSKDPEFECIVIKTQEQCQAMLPALHDGFTFDVETTSVTIQDAQLLGLAICAADDRAYYIDFSHNLLQTDSQSVSAPLFSVGESSSDLILYEASPLLTVLKPLFEDEGVQKCAHNAKYDIQVLASYGVQVRGIVFDTMLAASLLFPHEPIGLKAIVEKHCGVVMTSYEEVLGTEATLQTVSLQQVSTYAAADAFYTRKCQLLFLGLLEDKQLTELFFTIECPLVYPLAAMETAGVTLNVTGLNELRQTLLREQSNYEVQIYDYSKRPFNINSTKQLAVVLFDDLGLPVVKKTKTGRSTDVSVLEELQGKHPITELLLQYRTNEKLLNTYINAFPHLIHPKTGRIHTTFNQAVVITGRLSSSAPNLQNIPIRSKRGLEIRKVFIPRSKGRQLLALDYSQIELRLMAHFSGDKCMIDAFNAGEDIHKSTASIIFNCPIEEVTSEQRYNAKAVNFGIIYGISPFGLAKNLNCSRQDAKQLIDDYFAKFPKILEFIDATINIAKKDGFVRTAFGRRRPLPNINSSNKMKRQFEERAAVNTLLQGTASEIMKLGMIKVFSLLEQSNLDATMVLQVHDELVFDVSHEDCEELNMLVKHALESVVTYQVPLLVDSSVGNNWAFM